VPRPVKAPERDEIAPEEMDLYNKVVARYLPIGADPTTSDVKPDGYFGALLNSPLFAGNRQDISSMVRTAGERDNTYSHQDREFVDQVLAVHIGTNVVQRRHVPDAVACGVRIEAIDALRAGRDEDLTDDEQLLAEFIRQVVDGTVDDQHWDAIEARMGTRGAVEYTAFITILWLTMRQYQAFGLYDPPDSEVDEILDGLRTGARELPDWRAGIR